MHDSLQKLEAKSLIKLQFTKNSDGKYHCPVLFKVFNENSHIVAIKTSGNVFSYEAVEQLNFKAKNFKVKARWVVWNVNVSVVNPEPLRELNA